MIDLEVCSWPSLTFLGRTSTLRILTSTWNLVSILASNNRFRDDCSRNSGKQARKLVYGEWQGEWDSKSTALASPTSASTIPTSGAARTTESSPGSGNILGMAMIKPRTTTPDYPSTQNTNWQSSQFQARSHKWTFCLHSKKPDSVAIYL